MHLRRVEEMNKTLIVLISKEELVNHLIVWKI